MTRIVFVTGAGASKEFGDGSVMPVGSELAIRIEQLLDRELDAERRGPIQAVASAFARSGGFTGYHKSAMRRIRDGIQSKDSIDEFIDEWKDVPKLTEVGKHCIAATLLAAERSTLLGKMDSKQDNIATNMRSMRNSWLGILVRKLGPATRRRDLVEALADVAFITFNYDRCIEQYFYRLFTNTFGMPEERAIEALNDLQIYHVYGSLGILPGTATGIPFGASDDFIGLSAQGIRTFTEEMQDKDLDVVRSIIESAEKVVFLGLGYHDQNMEVLFGDQGAFNRAVWGTALGLRHRKIQELRSYFSAATETFELLEASGSELVDRFDEEIFGY